MKEFRLTSETILNIIPKLSAGDKIYLSGTIYTARDAAHKRIIEKMKNNEDLPFNIKNACIYYAGPTPTPNYLPIGSCGPTTSGRMDIYSPKMLDAGLKVMIGKGPRSKEVIDSMIKNGAIYLCAIGGAGALATKCIKSAQIIAFEDLGCESIKKIEFNDFPLIVGIDSKGGSLF